MRHSLRSPRGTPSCRGSASTYLPECRSSLAKRIKRIYSKATLLDTLNRSSIHPSSSSNGNGGTKSEGQAYDEVSTWLVPVYTPIAHFIREQLQAEQHRLSQNGREEDGDDHIDPGAVTGSSARLNEYFIGRIGTGMPQYQSTMLPSMLWETTCTVNLPGGKTLYVPYTCDHNVSLTISRSEYTVQTGKKPGMQVTAYKILVELGLEETIYLSLSNRSASLRVKSAIPCSVVLV